MVLFDLLGRRMTLRILWELREQQLTFRALVEAAETNPALLNVRLRELREAGLVANDGSGYQLTDDGRSLVPLLLPIVEWSEAWARTPSMQSDKQ